jgi:hypothetical protein
VSTFVSTCVYLVSTIMTRTHSVPTGSWHPYSRTIFGASIEELSRRDDKRVVNYCFDDGNSWFNCVLFSHAGLADTTPTNTTVRDLPSGRSYRGCTTLHDTVIICGGRSDDNLSDAHIHYPDNDSHSHIVAPRFLTPGHGLHLWCHHSKQLDCLPSEAHTTTPEDNS